MARNDLKTRKAIYTTINNKIHTKISEHSKRTQVPLSRIIDMALEAYLKERGIDVYDE